MEYKKTQNSKKKGKYMTVIHDQIADEITAKGHSATLLGILSNLGLKKLTDWTDFIKQIQNERT